MAVCCSYSYCNLSQFTSPSDILPSHFQQPERARSVVRHELASFPSVKAQCLVLRSLSICCLEQERLCRHALLPESEYFGTKDPDACDCFAWDCSNLCCSQYSYSLLDSGFLPVMLLTAHSGLRPQAVGSGPVFLSIHGGILPWRYFRSMSMWSILFCRKTSGNLSITVFGRC